MAVITSAASGNFTDAATWVGGVVPGVGDEAVAATGHVVAIDADVTLNEVRQAGTGRFTLGAGRTLTANVQINAGTFTSFGTVEATAGVGTTATIVGNVAGASSTLANQAGVVMTGVGTLVVNGTVTGTAGNATDNAASECAAVYTNVSSTVQVLQAVTAGGVRKYGVYAGSSGTSAVLTITGNVTGGTNSNAYGAYTLGASASLTITGNVTGGGTANAIGALASGTTATLTITGNVTGGTVGNAIGAYTLGASASLTITGNVTGGNAIGARTEGASATLTITGDVTGGGGSTAFGANATGATSLTSVVGNLFATGQNASAVSSTAVNAGSGVVLTGNMTDSSLGATALNVRIFRLNATTSGTTTYTNNVGYPTGGFVTRVSPDLTTGMPSASDVRSGTVFGAGSTLTGTLAVPPTNAVGAGVPVDNTTGTAALSPADIAALVGAQIAATLDATP